MHVVMICMSHEFVKYAHIIKYHIPYVLPPYEEAFLHIFFLILKTHLTSTPHPPKKTHSRRCVKYTIYLEKKMSDLIISCSEGGYLPGLVAQFSGRDVELMMIDREVRKAEANPVLILTLVCTLLLIFCVCSGTCLSGC